jgi:putative ABC transport system permease protein
MSAPGRLLVVARLAIGDVKRRPAQAFLVFVMIATTSATLTIGLSLRHVTEDPFARTRAASAGPDAVIEVGGGQAGASPSATQVATLAHAPGVTAVAGPFPVAFVRLRAGGIDVPVQLEGRDEKPAAVIDRPLVTSGQWVRSGGAVIERGLADALGLRVGGTIKLGQGAFRVVGVAVTTGREFYPAATPGLVWLTRNDTERLMTNPQQDGYLLDVKLANPGAAPAFADELNSPTFANATAGAPYLFEDWQQIRSNDYKIISVDRKVLLIASSLLSLLAVASVAVVVGSRLADQKRRVGLLKAIGATPQLVAVVMLAQNVTLAMAGAAAGAAAGDLLVPLLASPGVGLPGRATSPSVTAGSAAAVLAAAVLVAAAATIPPAVSGARVSTLRALNDSARAPRHRAGLVELSSKLPVPLLLGLRLIGRRVRRTILTTTSHAIAVTLIVAAITLQHNGRVKQSPPSSTAFMVTSYIGDRVNHLVFLLSAILVILAAINAIFVSWATVIDAQRFTALLRALGATPRQVTAGLASAQLLPAFAAACIGVPGGLTLYTLAAHGARPAPPGLPLLAVVPATLATVALLTAIPARIGARRSVVEVLSTE